MKNIVFRVRGDYTSYYCHTSSMCKGKNCAQYTMSTISYIFTDLLVEIHSHQLSYPLELQSFSSTEEHVLKYVNNLVLFLTIIILC